MIDNEPRCYECRKVSGTDKVEITKRDGKTCWTSPTCFFEHPIVNRVFPPEEADNYTAKLTVKTE